MSDAREGQHRSPFTTILETLCDSCVGAIGAGLVDEEGECVDLAFVPNPDLPDVPAYAIKLAGAHWQLVMRDASASSKFRAAAGDLRQIWVAADAFGYVMAHLHAGYVLIVICQPSAMPAVSHRALRQVEVELYAEAGWPRRAPSLPYWRRVHVLVDKQNQPCAFRYALGFTTKSQRGWDAALTVTEKLRGLHDFERGYRVRTQFGDDFEVVREPSGFWYAVDGIDRA